MATRTVRLGKIEAIAHALNEICAEARKQPGEVVSLNFARVRELAAKLLALVS